MSSFHEDTAAVAPQSGFGAAFVLGSDGPSLSRRGAARARSSPGGSKIPLQPSGTGGASASHADGVPSSMAPQPAEPRAARPQMPRLNFAFLSQVNQSAEPGAAPAFASGPSTAAAPAPQPSAAFERPQGVASAGTSAGGAPPLAQPPVFAVGAGDHQAGGIRTPKGGRTRGGRYKAPTPSPLHGAAAGAANAVTPGLAAGLHAAFTPISMTPLDAFQKASDGRDGFMSPMDITPPSEGGAVSNLFEMSPLVGVVTGAQAAPSAAIPPSARAAQPEIPAAAKTNNAGAYASGSAPASAGSSAGGATATAPDGPAAAPAAPAAATVPEGAPPANANQFPGTPRAATITVQMPGRQVVQDLFSDVNIRGGGATARGLSRFGIGPFAAEEHTARREPPGPPGPSSAPMGSTAPVTTAGGAATVGTGSGFSFAWQQAAAAAAAAKKMTDGGSQDGRGDAFGGAVAGQTGGNDCQPAKDNAPKTIRVPVDGVSGGAGNNPANGTTAQNPGPFGSMSPRAGSGAVPSTAKAPPAAEANDAGASAPANTAAAGHAASAAAAIPTPDAAAAAGISAALRFAGVSAAAAAAAAASSSSNAWLEAADELERTAKHFRQVHAAQATPAAKVEMALAFITSNTNPLSKAALAHMLRPEVLGQAKPAEPGLAAAVARMLGGLNLGEGAPSEAAAGRWAEARETGVAAGGAEAQAEAATAGAAGASVAPDADKTAAAVPGPEAKAAAAAAPVSVPFVFAGTSSGSSGGSFADRGPVASASSARPAAAQVFGSAAAAGTRVTSPQAQPQAQPQPQPVPFVFGAATGFTPREGGASTTTSPQHRGVPTGPSIPGAVPQAGPQTAAPVDRPGSGGSAASWAFTFGATRTPQPQPQAEQAASMATSGISAGPRPSFSGVSVSGAPVSASLNSAGPSPMSTTPVSSNHRPDLQPSAPSSFGWGPAAAAQQPAGPSGGLSGGSSLGGAVPSFNMGSSGGGAEAFGAAAGGAGITPGKRVRAKVTPRKTRGASHTDGGAAQHASAGGFSAGAAAAPGGSSAAAAGAAGASQTAAEASSQRAQTSAAPAAMPAHQAGAHSQQQQQRAPEPGVDALSMQAVRLKRTAEEKKQCGNQKYEVSDFKSAERWYSEALNVLEQQLPALGLTQTKIQELFPNLRTEMAVLYSNRSGARLMTSKPRSALEDALRAMELDPKFMRGASRAATCYCRLGEFKAAEKVVSEALSRCATTSPNYSDVMKKYEEVINLKDKTKAALTAALAAAASGARERLQEAADQLYSLRDHVSFCDLVAAARAVMALRLGSPRDAMTLVAPHPEVPVAQRAAPWRGWVAVQARYFKGELQEALTACREVQRAVEADPSVAGQTADGAGSSPHDLASHVAVPDARTLAELAENIEQQLKLKEEGNAHYKAGCHKEAVDSYTRALALGCCPAFAAVLHSNRAASQQALGLLPDAVADCSRARALDPTYYRASSRLASLMIDLRRPDNAQGLLEKLTKMDAQNGGAGPSDEELKKIQARLVEARSMLSWQKTPHHYKVLGLTTSCSEEDVRKAYRRLALKFHPDKAMAAVKVSLSLPGAAGKAPFSGPLAGASELEARVRDEAGWLFNFINQANEELSDKAKRRKVDQLLEAEQPPQAAASRYPGGANSGYYGGYGGGYQGPRYPNYSAYGDFAQQFKQAGSAFGGAAASGSRARTATGGGAAGGSGAGGFGGFGGYGSFGGARPAGTRPAGPSQTSAAGANARGSGAGAGRAGSAAGAAGGAAAGGSHYGVYGRAGGTGAGGAGGSRGAAGGGRKWWEGGADDSDEEDQESFNF